MVAQARLIYFVSSFLPKNESGTSMQAYLRELLQIG